MTDRSPSYDDQLARLKAELRELRDRADQAAEREARVGQPRQPRLARTCREDHDVDDYPSSGDTFWIQFLDSTFTETEGDQTPDHTERQEDGAVVAHSLQGHLAEDTVVFAIRDNGRWWIWTGSAAGATLLWGRQQEDMDYDGRSGNGPGVISRLVEIKNCTWDGTVDGSQFTARTGLIAVDVTGPGKDTNLRTDSMFNYQIEPDGTPVIVSDIWDDPIGTVKAWNITPSGPSGIRDGWREMDGSGDATDLRGMVLVGEDAEDGSGYAAATGHGFSQGDTFGDPTHDHGCIHTTTTRAYDNSGGDTFQEIDTVDGKALHTEVSNYPPFYAMRFIERFE